MIKLRTNAKVNLTLDVVGKKDGFHLLDSFVCSLSLFNEGKFRKRKDKKLNIKFIGESVNISPEKSKAYLAGKEFIKKYKLSGADVIIKRNIPTGAGLGGSSSDVVAVLNGLNKLYKVNADLTALSNKYGSDCLYMLNGGYKRLKGRGDIIEDVSFSGKLYFIILTSEKGVSTKECFSLYDKNKVKSAKTEKVINCFNLGMVEEGLKELNNALYNSAKKLLPEIESKYKDLLSVGSAVMTGSGSSVVGVYKNKKDRKKAYLKLKDKYKNLILAKSI